VAPAIPKIASSILPKNIDKTYDAFKNAKFLQPKDEEVVQSLKNVFNVPTVKQSEMAGISNPFDSYKAYAPALKDLIERA
jgi:hypothetical protein